MAETIYSVDTSAIVDLRFYPEGVMAPIWEGLGTLVKKGRLISVPQAYAELKDGHGPGNDWARKHRRIFKALRQAECDLAKEIINKYPKLSDHNADRDDADPYIIAQALAGQEMEGDHLPGLENRKFIVVAHERGFGLSRMEGVCKVLKVAYMDLPKLFEAEGWKLK